MIGVHPPLAAHQRGAGAGDFCIKRIKASARAHPLRFNDLMDGDRREQCGEQGADVWAFGRTAAEREAIHGAGFDDGAKHARKLEDHGGDNSTEQIGGGGGRADAEEGATAGLVGTKGIGPIEPWQRHKAGSRKYGAGENSGDLAKHDRRFGVDKGGERPIKSYVPGHQGHDDLMPVASRSGNAKLKRRTPLKSGWQDKIANPRCAERAFKGVR